MSTYFKVFIRAHESWCPRVYCWRLCFGVFDFVIHILTFAYVVINHGTCGPVFDVLCSGWLQFVKARLYFETWYRHLRGVFLAATEIFRDCLWLLIYCFRDRIWNVSDFSVLTCFGTGNQWAIIRFLATSALSYICRLFDEWGLESSRTATVGCACMSLSTCHESSTAESLSIITVLWHIPSYVKTGQQQ
jgi:hypothetical protein